MEPASLVPCGHCLKCLTEASLKIGACYSWLELLEMLPSAVDQEEGREMSGLGLVGVVSVPRHTYWTAWGRPSGKVFSLALQGHRSHLLGVDAHRRSAISTGSLSEDTHLEKPFSVCF